MAATDSASLDELLQIAKQEHLIDQYRKGREQIVIRQEGFELALSPEEASAILSKMLQYQWRDPERNRD